MKTKLSLRLGLALTVAALLAACGGETSTPASAPAAGAGDVRTVGVDAVAKDPKAHAGRVGIEGVVAKVFADRGAFTIIDAAEYQACGETGCAEYNIPVQVPKAEFEGTLPASEENVLVIGTVEPTEKGFKLIVEEILREGKVVLRKKAKAQ